MNMVVHYSSATAEWSTPQDFFDALDAEFHFTLDVCATPQNTKCAAFYSSGSLERPWVGTCYMNPPYGRKIGKWIRKAYESSFLGATVVCLVPARTDTAWWHDYCMRGEVRFVRGRLYFGGGNGARSPAPFPSAIVIFRAVRPAILTPSPALA